MSGKELRLGVNIDHVATLRNARGEGWPDTLRAAKMVKDAGAHQLTIHLREDRRHIRDADVPRLIGQSGLPVNFECAASDEMLGIIQDNKPMGVCLVPEKREELTTEGGLNVAAQKAHLTDYVAAVLQSASRVSMFVDADPEQLQASRDIGATAVELHTGRYANLSGDAKQAELKRLQDGARMAADLGLEVHAGHGLTFDNVGPVAAIPQIEELNIGHFLIAESLFKGLKPVVGEMLDHMAAARP